METLPSDSQGEIAGKGIPGETPSESAWRSILVWSDVAVFLAIFAGVAVFAERNVIFSSGCAIAVAGFVLWMVARWQLGKSFAIRVKATQLVTTGLYRHFRHPIYYGGFLGYFGVLFALQIWWVLGIWLTYSLAIQLTRSRAEDRALEAAFGDEFRRLRRGAWI